MKDLEDGTAVLTRAQRSLLVPIRTAYHTFLQHYRKRLCFLDTMTLLKIDSRMNKGQIMLAFEEMGLKVKRVFRLHWGSESKLGWCHVQFTNNETTVTALKTDLTTVFGPKSYGHYRARISAWSFAELVPPWIVGPVQLTCLCWRCENGKLIWEAAKKLISCFDTKQREESCDEGEDIEEEEGPCQDLADLIKEAERHAVVDGVQLASTPHDAIRCCCCDPGEGEPVAETCINGSCVKCYPGLKRISNLYCKRTPTTERKTVKFDVYDLRHTMPKSLRQQREANGKSTSRKRVRTTIFESVARFLVRFKLIMIMFAEHTHLASWQQSQHDWLREHLPRGSIMSEWDFAENYSYVSQTHVK